MKIIRDGKEIELTYKEMRDIWEEWQHEIDREDLEIFCEGNEYLLTEDEKEEVLQRYHRMMNNSEDWGFTMDEACKTVMRKRG